MDAFFDSVLDGEMEKLIVKLVGQDMDPEKILDVLISKSGGGKK